MAQSVNVKSNVIFNFFTRPVLRILLAVLDTWDNAEPASPFVTSAFDGKHMKDSLHYKGYALDFRTNSLSDGAAKAWSERMRKALGPDYDVVLESNHLHVEYHPKVKNG